VFDGGWSPGGSRSDTGVVCLPPTGRNIGEVSFILASVVGLHSLEEELQKLLVFDDKNKKAVVN